jgi:hypothetical protein
MNVTSIEYNIPQDGTVIFQVMTVSGQLMYEKFIEAKTGKQTFQLNTQQLANGIYYYSMEYAGKRIVKKMNIQR